MKNGYNNKLVDISILHKTEYHLYYTCYTYDIVTCILSSTYLSIYSHKNHFEE